MPIRFCAHQSVEYVRDQVGRYGRIGIDEFVLHWPGARGVFEQVCAEVLPALRDP
jgi:hypothetical protein